MHVVQSWSSYLTNRPFIIRTDQRSLKYLLEQKVTTPFQHLWLSKFMGYSYEIHYKQGKENTIADALSRISRSQLLTITLTRVHKDLYDANSLLWHSDPTLHKIIADLQSEASSHPKLYPTRSWTFPNCILITSSSSMVCLRTSSVIAIPPS